MLQLTRHHNHGYNLLNGAHNVTITQLLLPLVIAELVAMVVRWDDVCEQDVLGLGVHSRHLDLVAREHPPVGDHMVRCGVDDSMAAWLVATPFSPQEKTKFSNSDDLSNANHLIFVEDCLSRIKLLD